MKTTIELDEAKLLQVMELTGIATRRAAIDFALSEAARAAVLRRLLDTSFYVTDDGPVIAPDYDLLALREAERPDARAD